MPTLIEHFGFWPLVAQRLARMAEAPNQSLEQPLAGKKITKLKLESRIMKRKLAPASGGSAGLVRSMKCLLAILLVLVR